MYSLIEKYINKIRVIDENRHYAFFVSNGEIFSIGMNTYIKYKTCTTIHAELMALKKIQKYKECPKKADIIVIKIKKNGDYHNGKPCNHCIKILMNSKIKFNNVFYSTEYNGKCHLIKTKINKFNSDSENKGLRHKCVNTEYLKNK